MESTSVICGIDLGSWSIKISVFSGDGFQILTNEANFRETPTLVGYTQAERLIGEQALIKVPPSLYRSKPTTSTLFELPNVSSLCIDALISSRNSLPSSKQNIDVEKTESLSSWRKVKANPR